MGRGNIVLAKSASRSFPLLDVPAASWLVDCEEEPWDGRSPIGTGAHLSMFDGVEFHSCFYRSETGSRRLVVSLTSGGHGRTRENGPRFNRWTYVDETDSNMLCVDDPMVYLHGIKYGWFGGGTVERPMWAALAKMINAVCAAAGLEDPEVVFFSSSSGGVASILASSEMGVPCTVVALNPQLCIPSATRYKGYRRRGFLCPALDDPNFVLDIMRDHRENRYVVIENMASRLDYNQYFVPMCNRLAFRPTYGVTRHGNVVTWVYCAKVPRPHSAMDWKTIFPAMEFLVDNLDSLDSVPGHLLDMFTALIEEHHAQAAEIARLEGAMGPPGEEGQDEGDQEKD